MLTDILYSLRDQPVMIIGDLILDEYLIGNVRRISPEAPIPVVELRSRRYHPGGASNVAVNIAALGGLPLLCGVVGTDALAAVLEHALRERFSADSMAFFSADDRPTTLKSRVIAQGQQMMRIDSESTTPISPEVENALIAWAKDHISNTRACILSDYAKGVLTPRVCSEIIALCRSHNVPVIVDPKGREYRRYKGATLIKPNLDEASLAVNMATNKSVPPDTLGEALLEMLPGTAALITRGEEGMSLYRADCPPVHIPAFAHEVYDVTGAGDTVIGTLGLSLAAGASMEDAALLANMAASVVVGKLGAATASPEEIERMPERLPEPV